MKIALFPGSFDPITIAHVDILNRAQPLFDKIVIGIGLNSAKQNFLSAETREEIVKTLFAQYKNVEVQLYQGLTVDFCKKIKAKYMVRGIRTASDFEYERAIAQINQTMMPEVETILLLKEKLAPYFFCNSRGVQEELVSVLSLYFPNTISVTFPEALDEYE